MSTKFRSSAADEMAVDKDYRPFSALAIVAFLISLVSVVSPFVPACLIFAVIALMLASIAIYRIRRDPTAVSGQGIAVAAICISLFFGGMTLSYMLSIQNYHERIAVENGKNWISIIQEGDPFKAFQMTRPPRLRNTDGRQGSKVTDGETDFSNFKNLGPVRAISGCEGEIEFIRVHSRVHQQGSGEFWILEYGFPADGPKRPNMLINMRRKYDAKTNTANWNVVRVGFAGAK